MKAIYGESNFIRLLHSLASLEGDLFDVVDVVVLALLLEQLVHEFVEAISVDVCRHGERRRGHRELLLGRHEPHLQLPAALGVHGSRHRRGK